MIHDRSFGDVLEQLLWELYEDGVAETNQRTGVEIVALHGGFSFKLDIYGNNHRLPVPTNRRYWPRVAAAEVAWQVLGTTDPHFIMEKAPKIWGDFIEDGKLKTAYGYRWRRCFGRDQLGMAIRALKADPSNRQLFVSAWNPASDGLGAPNQPKNIPCPVGFTVSQVQDTVHMSVFIRSSDVFVGLPYDVMGYALMLNAIACSVGYYTGTLHVTLAHPHYYMPHHEMVVESILPTHGHPLPVGHEPVLPNWTVEHIEQDPHGYVDLVTSLCKDLPKHGYSPAPMVIV